MARRSSCRLLVVATLLSRTWIVWGLSSSSHFRRGQQQQQQQQQQEIHRTIRELSNNNNNNHVLLQRDYAPMTRNVVQILESWAANETIVQQWRSVVNKANLCHEVEESIVALHYLQQWQEQQNQSMSYMAVDACCGKGLFSLLLSYLAPTWYPNLQRIILFDKDPNIDWTHIHAANQDCVRHGRPFMEVWPGTNLHEHDVLVNRLSDFAQPMALTGIHLCKTLSPALVGIANAIRAPYLCVAPCCLPRPNQQLLVPLYESAPQRQARLVARDRRAAARERRRSRCFVCHGAHHVRDCPQQQNHAISTTTTTTTTNEWNIVVQNALLSMPCWRCGQAGHCHDECSETLVVPERPCTQFNMTAVVTSNNHNNNNPFEDYCHALSKCVETCSTPPRVVDSGLTSSASQKQHTNNWNRDRKALFIVAS